MKLKRFAIILLAVAIFASVLAVSASAAEIQPYNNVDQAYSFNFNGSWWQDDLHQYWKENSTSVYIYSKAFPGRYNIYTNGYVNGSWGDYTQRPAVVPGVGEYVPMLDWADSALAEELLLVSGVRTAWVLILTLIRN